MKLNPTDSVLDLEGNEQLYRDDKPLNFRDLVISALTAPEENQESADKAKAFELSLRMYLPGEIELSVDEAAFIKAKAGKFLLVIPYGRLCEWIEGQKPQFHG